MAASSKQLFLGLIVLVLLQKNEVYAAKLNAPKVLLPYCSSVVANYTLEVEFSPEESKSANCYRWRSTRQDVAQVQLIDSPDGECSNKAVVYVISKSAHQMTTVVLAENWVTGEILKCNVIVDEISKLLIDTTTRLLYLEDSPEELTVRGYDTEGNIFSSLEGLIFEWSLVSDTETGQAVMDAHNILRIKRFAESHYTAPHHIATLEQRGLQGDTILVEGIRTGSAKVSTRLKDSQYKSSVPIDDVRIMVIANLMLSPPEAYVLKHAQVKYLVELLKHNKLTEIKMPSCQYYLEVVDALICKLNKKTSIVTAEELGTTEIVLKDKNIHVTEFFRQPSAVLHVVNPGYLAFVVLPTRKWVLETGREYEVLIEVYDKDSHKIFPSNNLRLTANFVPSYFKVLFSTNNGTYHHVKTLKKGYTDIDGELNSVIREDGSVYDIFPKIKGSQEVEIYDPISVTPPVLFFPWDPVTRCNHKYKIQASGGSGEYVWSSADSSVSTVNIKGEAVTMGLGTTNITAADAKNSAHTGTVTVHVLPPHELVFPPSKVEAVIGSMLRLPLQVSALFEGEKLTFFDCRNMPLNITFSDNSVFTQDSGKTSIPADGCTTLNFKAVRQGHTEVTARYQIGKVTLQASLTIAAYNPLKPVDPETETVIVAASSKEVLFKGGPQPWVLDSSKYFQSLSGEKPTVLMIEKVTVFNVNRGFHAFTVLCKDFGDQRLTLTVGNHKTAKNQFPDSAEASIRFMCAKPVELHLLPVMHSDPSLPPCPVTQETHNPIPILCNKERDIEVIVTDSSGRRFDNISSLAIDWTISSRNLATIPQPANLHTDANTTPEGRKIVKAYQKLVPNGKTGSVIVTATINSYKQHSLKVAGSWVEAHIHPSISKSLELQLVEKAFIHPDTVSVFNHPSNKVEMEVNHGSGYFYIEEFKSHILSVKYDIKSKAILIRPQNDGSHSFTLYDLCLDVVEHPVATVHIAGVGSIRVVTLDKVEVRKELLVRVQVLDIHGNMLLSSLFSLMGLKLEPSSQIVSLRPTVGEKDDKVTSLYTLYGSAIGHTTLTAMAKLPNGQVIYSSPTPVEVFPPLRLEPKNITIIIGAKFKVLAVGGPQPQSTVEFSIVDGKISSVSSNGLLEALTLGTTRVIGKAVGNDPLTGELVVYSQDEAIVNVVLLKGVRIFAPLTRLQTGTKMPVYAMGLNEQETPFSFGSSVPPLSFTWSVNSRQIVTLKPVYHKSGIWLTNEYNFAQQLFAVNSGHMTLKLEVEPLKGYDKVQIPGNVVLKDEVQIQVFEKLTMLNPSVCDGQILVTPNTETVIRTNRDLDAQVNYEVFGQSKGIAIVTVNNNGLLTTGPIPGTAIIHITAQEEFGINQTMVILVKVKTVSYMMLNADTVLRTTSKHLTSIPVGTTLQFSVSYHDDLGESFYTTNLHLNFRCSRYDLLHVSKGNDNSTLVVRTIEPGQTILKVWDKQNPWMADYINIPIGFAVSPSQAHFTLGSVICFNTPLVSETGHFGTWKSRNPSMNINSENGIATAERLGKTSIVYNVSTDITTYREIIVQPISTVTLACPVKYLTNVLGSSDAVNFPVMFRKWAKHFCFFWRIVVVVQVVSLSCCENCSALVKQKHYTPPSVPFNCHLEFTTHMLDINIDEVFHVFAAFDTDRAEHVCRVSQVINKQSHKMSTLNTQVHLKATVFNQGEQPQVESLPVTVDFYPAFYVHNEDVKLTTIAPLSSIRVSTLSSQAESIEISVSDSSLLMALSPEQDSQSGSVILYPIRLLESLSLWERENLDLWIELTGTLTGQKVEIPVYVKVIGEKPGYEHLNKNYRDVSWSYLLRNFLFAYQSWFATLVIVLITGAAVLFGYQIVLKSRFQTVPGNTSFMSSGQLVQHSPSGYLQNSPMSGSPYPIPSSPTSPRLWSVNYNQQDRSPLRRSPYYKS
ncbi:nuclear pore membrane glycoprotein 210-like [Gigantopelta aegis]|uniref:nuclear pore membrane glycoprotein 210-like n=1 Tax=Gigantopelta aegis TaxID=1735272 RepID=UPI001B88B070|nr:nuclear pore membrane glycoprotein 210-like [Gigantopelta aegis]